LNEQRNSGALAGGRASFRAGRQTECPGSTQATKGAAKPPIGGAKEELLPAGGIESGVTRLGGIPPPGSGASTPWFSRAAPVQGELPERNGPHVLVRRDVKTVFGLAAGRLRERR